MRVIPVDQNSEQWMAVRRGLPTASEFHRIVCPAWGNVYNCECGTISSRKRKKCEACGGTSITESLAVLPSNQQDGYIYQLIGESLSGQNIQRPPNAALEHGHEHEADAAGDYSFLTGRDVEKVGFCVTDDGLLGCSPDRLVGDDGLLECKCPFSVAVHVRHMVMQDLEADHRVQVQAQMLVTGRKWVDVISWFENMPSVIIRVERDEEFISGMNDILVDFVTRLHRIRAELIAKYGSALPTLRQPPADEDVERILESQRTEAM